MLRGFNRHLPERMDPRLTVSRTTADGTTTGSERVRGSHKQEKGGFVTRKSSYLAIAYRLHASNEKKKKEEGP